MAIVDDDIERVKAAVSIADVIGQHTRLKRVGTRMQGLCPFRSHNDKTSSFSIGVQEGLYYYFGCGKRGDAITFVSEMDRIDFESAVERLASSVGITLRYTDSPDGTTSTQSAVG